MRTYGKVRNGIGTYTTPKGEKRYRVVYKDDKGKTRSKTFKDGEKTKAQHFRDNNAVAIHDGTWIDPSKGKKTFGVFADDVLATVKQVRRPGTHALYEYLLRVHIYPTFEDTPLRNITAESVRHWLADLHDKPAPTKSKRLSPATIAKAYRLLRRILRVAVEEGYIGVNPCNVKGAGKEDPTELHCPSADDVMKLADAVGQIHTPYRAMVLVAGWGGLRWGEVIALRRRHVDIAKGCVHVREQVTEVNGYLSVSECTKTAAGKRTVYLPDVVMSALALHLAQHTAADPDALLFRARRQPGRKAQDQAVNYLRGSRFRRDVWLPATKAAACEGVRFHDLRHAAATLAAITGATTKELMQRMGHASPAAALRYQHTTEERQRAIARGLDHLAPPTGASGKLIAIRGKISG